MVDTTKIADDLNGLGSRLDDQIKAGGVKFTISATIAVFTFLSTVAGGLYYGYQMYEKIEAVAGLDLGEYQTQMDLMDANIQQTMDYTREIKGGLRDDILSIERQADRIEDMVRKSEDKVRDMIDAAEVRFENQRERVRVSQSGSMKELEAKLMDKLQRALDNPLAD